MGPGTMLNSWADAMLAELSSPECEQQDAQIQEVDDIRSQTSDASETEPSQSDESVLEHRWWVSRLFSSVERLGFLDAIENAKSQAHAAKRQLQVLSCCTGCCAETEVLKALELPHQMLSASELRSDFRRLFLDNSQPGTFQHVFASVEDQLAGNPCLLHPERASCDSCDDSQPSLMISGSPCDPFSQQSGKRFQPGAVSGHKLFSVTMESIIAMYIDKQPPIGLFEQVMGFVMPFDAFSTETPYQRFVALFSTAMTKANIVGYYLTKFELCASTWLKISRPRVYIVLFRKDKFSKEQICRFKKAVEDLVNDQRTAFSPLPLTELMLPAGTTLFKQHLAKILESKQERGAPSAAPDAGTLPAWAQQDLKIRSSISAPRNLKPWTFAQRRFTGINATVRAKACIDLAVLQYLGVENASRSMKDLDQQTELVSDLFVDISQNPCRKAFSNQEGCAKCLTTATVLYSCKKDRIVLPLELLMFQGHTKELKIPAEMSPDAVKCLAGEGIALPYLATLIVAMVGTGLLAV